MRHLGRAGRAVGVALIVVAISGCHKQQQIGLQYEFLSGLAPTDVIRVETRVTVAPTDPRAFIADIPFHSVELGVGFEVRDFDGTGTRTLLITHDASLGYTFDASFVFTLLPPAGHAPPLRIHARALGAGLTQVLADSGELDAVFGANAQQKIPLADLRCGGVAACTGNDSCCGASCTDVNEDVSSCGACGAACGTAGDACSGSACRCNGGGACTSGSACCRGTGCIDTRSDPFSCGSCGRACAPGEGCVAGACACGSGGTSCASGEICCNGVCKTTGCDCGGATCTTTAPLCCGASCTTTANDDANCGSCGKVCGAPFKCAGGKCQCNGTSVCGPSDTCCPLGCKDVMNDPLNCGGCGIACGAGETCSNGMCRCGLGGGCTSPGLCCSDASSNKACTNSSTDRYNCGGCGIKCAATEGCINSACQCPGVGMPCGGLTKCCPALMACYDLNSDPMHCGSCGAACAATEVCTAGQCKPSTGTICNTPCTKGTSCVNGQCMCGTVVTSCTGTTEACCAGTNGCVDLGSDVNNCGACGVQVSAQGADYCCNGTPTAHSSLNCGGCNIKCTATSPTCTACSGGWICLGVGMVCAD